MNKLSKLIVGNLKMNLDLDEISSYLDIVNNNIDNRNVVICPTSIYIPYFLCQKYSVGIQNTFLTNQGAYTGEISPKQVDSMGVAYTILGHSERRLYLKETDEMINKKIIAAVNNYMKVIICIGETLEERKMLKTDKVIKRQIISCLRNLNKKQLENIIIAYEPIWAIGTNQTPTNKDIGDMIAYIKMLVENHFQYSSIKVLYGGSVNEKNIKKLNTIKGVDGYLIGNASTDANQFLKIIEVALNK
ncbi:MAG: triose-phosphate isomerase [Bacilli bacterium]